MVNGTIDIYTYVRTRVFQSVVSTTLLATTVECTTAPSITNDAVTPAWAMDAAQTQRQAA
jgi:hypothetical protein